jgi:putative SOS response-associated peptidase YedK
MCGRFVVAGASTDLVALFDVDLIGDDLPPDSWNVAPTDRVPILLDAIPKGDDADREPIRRLEAARWGLVPSWAKDTSGAARSINARIETVAEKPTFKTAVHKRRAVVPANGYYEWHTVDGTKTPHFIHLPGAELTLFAGLYEWWRDPSKADDDATRWLLTTTILTQDSVGELRGIHDRMPVFLSGELIDEWLDPHTDDPEDLLPGIAAEGVEVAARMQFHEVDRAVGNVRTNSPDLILPIDR